MDPAANQYTNHPAYQIARDALQFLTMAFAFYAAQTSTRNHSKMEVVEQRQQEVAVKQDMAAGKAAEVKAVLERKLEEDNKALGVQLYSTWKYLDDVASWSMNARDRVKAAEAKAAYDDHVKRSAK